jgi:hypothetical protein
MFFCVTISPLHTTKAAASAPDHMRYGSKKRFALKNDLPLVLEK